MCALNDATSFEEMKELHEAILRVKDDGEKVPFVIAANKSVGTSSLPSSSFFRVPLSGVFEEAFFFFLSRI